MPIIFGAVSHMGLMLIKIWERNVITLNMKVRYVKEQNSAVIIYAIHVWLTSHFRNNVCTLFLKTYQGK